MNIRIASTLVLSLLLLLASCQSKLNPSFPKTNTVPFRAAFVDTNNSGRILPIARQDFYLLKEDLAKVLQEKKMKTEDVVYSPYDRDSNIRLKEMLIKDGKSAEEAQKVFPVKDEFGIEEDKIKEYIVGKTKTDFEGNGKFENIPHGTYYMVGIGVANEAYVIWNEKVDVSESTDKKLLDQKQKFDWGIWASSD